MSETATAADAATRPWVVPASYAQERVWFASQFASDVPVYHVQDRIRLPYPLRAEQLLDVLATIADRHETLRTSFRLDDGALVQEVYPPPELPVEVVDLTGEPADAVPGRIDRLGDEIIARPFELDRPPLWRARLLRLGEASWVLLFIAHHAVMDAASCLNLRAELTELCDAAVRRRPAALPELPIQYGDYAVWQRNQMQGDTLARLEGYWRGALADLPTVHGLPTDRPRPLDRGFAGSEIIFELPRPAVDALPAVARRAGATPFMVLLAGYVATLHRLSGRHDIAIGVPVAGRDLPELQPLIGMFVNMVVLRLRLTGDETFAALVDQVLQTSVAAWDHQDMPFQKLVEAFAAHRRPGVAPLYQLGFNYLPTTVNSQSGTAEDDLMLELDSRNGRLEYNTALFDESTAREIVDCFRRVLTTALTDPGVALTALPVAPLHAAPPISAPHAAPPISGMSHRANRSSEMSHSAKADPAAEPRTAAEELVARVWQEVLGVERVGATDDFFALGGHSLLALRVIARLSAAIEVDVPIQAFFADTTVAGVAAEVERLLAAEIDALSEEEALHELGSNR